MSLVVERWAILLPCGCQLEKLGLAIFEGMLQDGLGAVATFLVRGLKWVENPSGERSIKISDRFIVEGDSVDALNWAMIKPMEIVLNSSWDEALVLFISNSRNGVAGLLEKSGVDSEELLWIFSMLKSYFVDCLGWTFFFGVYLYIFSAVTVHSSYIFEIIVPLLILNFSLIYKKTITNKTIWESALFQLSIARSTSRFKYKT